MAAFADQSIFNVTQALKAKGMFENTVLIVTTDNGASYDNGNNYVCCVNTCMMCLCISLIEHFAIKYMYFESSSNSMTDYFKFYLFYEWNRYLLFGLNHSHYVEQSTTTLKVAFEAVHLCTQNSLSKVSEAPHTMGLCIFQTGLNDMHACIQSPWYATSICRYPTICALANVSSNDTGAIWLFLHFYYYYYFYADY